VHGNFQKSLVLPYENYELFRHTGKRLSSWESNTTKMNEFVRPGRLCGVMLKAKFE
jgi:hypothetical protein